MKPQNKIRFIGRRIQLPWSEWIGIEISPEGIHTPKGFISISQLETIIWKANAGFTRWDYRELGYEIDKNGSGFTNNGG